MTSDFARYSPEDLRALIAEYPLAWIVPQGGPASAATQLPLLAEFADDGALVALVGHMSRQNPLLDVLCADGRATILFSGPHGYVSPSHAGLRNWGPTWNLTQLVVECAVEVLPDLTEEAIARLVEAMEPAGSDAWSAADLGERYTPMLARIIGFRAKVSAVTGRFKLGQDERPEVLRAILSTHGNAALVDWMGRMNEGRGDA
jgi:transcriptional regulator